MIAELQTGRLDGDLVWSLAIDALSIPESGRPLRPFQIVSPIDMLFDAYLFYKLSMHLRQIQTQLGEWKKQPDYQDKIPDDIRGIFTGRIGELLTLCDQMGLEFTGMLIKEVRVNLTLDHYTSSRFASDLGSVFTRSEHEIIKQKFFVIPRVRAEWYGQMELFGADVANKFPSANFDIEEAGNCYALDRNTACVFHSMRVLEKGLLALAADLSITFPVSITLENWQNIIEKIESEIKAINNQPKSLQKSSDLQFYSEAAKEFRYFKDAWRNHVSHSREKYGDAEALRVLTHVKDFMQHLATRLKE